ncbi:MAG TPA: alpha/beta hydrolase, partial [Rudaea sp.]
MTTDKPERDAAARFTRRRPLRRYAAIVGLIACHLAHAAPTIWEPGNGHQQMRLWPGTPPSAKPMPGPETIRPGSGHLIAGKPVTVITNISDPTITVYPPLGKNTGAAVLVIPGGGFEILAIDFEGTEVCDWLVAEGITCVLEKYRVPSEPYEWKTNSRPRNLQIPTRSLQDTQRAMRVTRAHAAEWHIDPHRIGVLGFSAGGYLVAQISTNYDKKLYAAVDAADTLSARPDFAIAVYPGHLATERNTLNPNVPVTPKTPPTFIVQAEDDHIDGVEQAQVYFNALKEADVPTEL